MFLLFSCDSNFTPEKKRPWESLVKNSQIMWCVVIFFSGERELGKKTKLFIQVNIAEESQKSGVLLKDLNRFYYFCIRELSLNITGLMCLPPINSDSNKYFQILKKTSEKLNLTDLSMGMSADYDQAILNGSTYLRLGTAIFGARTV